MSSAPASPVALPAPLPAVYAQRRAALYARIEPGAAVLVPAAKEQRRNGTNHYPFRQSSDFLFLTGSHEPDALAVFTPHKPAAFTLFAKPRDLFRENWTGPRMGPAEAPAAVGCDQAFSLDELTVQLAKLLDDCTAVYLLPGDDPALDAQVLACLSRLHKQERNATRTPRRILDLSCVLHELRLVKDPYSLAAMRRSVEITAEAHLLAMRHAYAGQLEYQLGALIDYVFARSLGTPGYDTIVGAGPSATILHYTLGQQPLLPGQLLLVDAGCEHQAHTADITRTYPISSGPAAPVAFSPPQRALYEVVLHAQLAGIAAAQPGATVEDIHQACVRVATQGLIDLGLLAGSPADLIASRAYQAFYVHRTSHFLGMDVHDVGQYFPPPDHRPRPLSPGMILTIEPGLYIRQDAQLPPGCEAFRGIGIRIEDDVLITEETHPEFPRHEVLTRAVPKHPDDLCKIVGTAPPFVL